MKLTTVLSLIVIFLFTGSCSKQSADGVNDPEVRGREEQERLDACTVVNFNKGVFEYNNTLQLFKCTGWHKQYPSLYSSIQKVQADNWNHVFKPVNEAFLDNQARKDRVFRNIRELDSKKGLDDLSYVIVALNETNFFDSVKAMFKCVENPADELCKDRKFIPQKKSLKNVIHLVDVNPEVVGDAAALLRYLMKAIEPKQEELRAEVDKFRFANNYIPVRLRLFDSIANKIRTGFSEEDRKFAVKLLSVGAKDQDVPWIYQWLRDEKLGREKFRDLVEYPALTNPQFLKDLRGVKGLYNNGFNCTIKKDNVTNDLIEFDLKAGLDGLMKTVRNKDFKTFYDYTSMQVTGLRASSEICKELVSNSYNTNLVKSISDIAQFLSEKKNYDLMKFILNYSTVSGNPDKSFSENLYAADMLTGELFGSMNNLNVHILKNSREFFPVIYDILVTLPPEAILHLSNVISEVAKVENDAKFLGVADFWTFFNDEEKNFVFNFIDRHFDKNIKYALLFDFYAKFLDDVQETQGIFKEAWTGTDIKDEQSYQALQDLFYNMSGKDTLKDFKNFFSRDQILKVLEVLSNGQKIVDSAKEEKAYRDSTKYILTSKTNKYKYDVRYGSDTDIGYDSKAVLDCIKKFNEIEGGIYELVKKLPEACKAVSKENISFRLFGWMNFIEKDFSDFKKPNVSGDSLIDTKGLLSPYMLNTNLGLMKIADNLVGPYQSSVPTTNGIEYVLDSVNYYLNQKNGIVELNKGVALLNKYMDVDKENNIIFRNSLIKKFTKNENFNYTRNVISNISDLVMDYGSWIKSGEYAKAVNRSLGKFDPNNTCDKSINKFISENACPSPEAIKKYGNDLLFLLQNTWEKEMGSPLKHLLIGSQMGGYLEIPLYGKKTKKFHLTLTDNIKYLYDTFDRNLAVNNQNMKYVNANNQEAKVNVTTVERVETVIREVRFGNNYLGATYLNHIVEGDDYVKDVKQRKFLMSSCVKIPKMRCGRPMSDSDLRMAKNSLEAFDSLLDVDNGRGLEPKLRYGEFLKAFQQTLIASSSKKAQEVTFFPAKDEVLAFHNGRVLGDISMMNGYSNTARFIRDRFGRTREEFNAFINREDFKRVDRTMLSGYDMNLAVPLGERLVKKMITRPEGANQNLFETTVDWLASLNYEESRLVEDTIGRLMVVGSYLGSPEVVFNLPNQVEGYERYKDNNMFQMLMATDRLISFWPTLQKYFPGDVKLVEVIKPVNTFLYFLTEKLKLTNNPAENKTYIALNDLFYVLQSTVFDDVEDGRIIGKSDKKFKGVDFIIEGLKDPELVKTTYATIRDQYKFSDVFYQNNGQFFLASGQNLKRLSTNSRVDMTPIQDYLNFSSKNAVCVAGDSQCAANYHYDEGASILQYLAKTDSNGTTYLNILNRKIFQENYKDLVQMIDDLIPALRIKSVRPPLAF